MQIYQKSPDEISRSVIQGIGRFLSDQSKRAHGKEAISIIYGQEEIIGQINTAIACKVMSICVLTATFKAQETSNEFDILIITDKESSIPSTQGLLPVSPKKIKQSLVKIEVPLAVIAENTEWFNNNLARKV